MKTTQDFLTEAAQLIRERGWWNGGSPCLSAGSIHTKCAQEAVSKVTSTESPSYLTYSEVMQELANRIKIAYPEFIPSLRERYGSPSPSDYSIVTQFNDTRSSVEPILALMEGRESS